MGLNGFQNLLKIQHKKEDTLFLSGIVSVNTKNNREESALMSIVAPPACENQEELSRAEKRRLERQRKKIEKRLNKAGKNNDLDVRFNNKTVSSSATFTFLEAFKKVMGLNNIIGSNFSMKSYHNQQYSFSELLEQAIDSLLLGYSRFSHMQQLKNDPGYKIIKEKERIPDESTVRKLFPKMQEEQIKSLEKINKVLLQTLVKMLPPQYIWVDFDDSVITVHGEQENSDAGYNPRYRGRPSYKVKVGFISELDLLLKMGLYSGKTASNGDFLPFLKETIEMVKNLGTMVIKGVRMDKGFFDNKNFEELEEESIYYVCKVPLRPNIKKMISYVDGTDDWVALSKTYDYAELTVPLPSWEKARRFIFIREKIKGKEGSLFSGEVIQYRYEVMVTNIDDMNPEEVWHCYNKRCDVENRIDELKEGFALDKASQNQFFANYAFAIVKGVAYNILQGFKWLLPKEVLPFEAPRVRRTFINQPGNIRGKGRNRYISLPPNSWLEKAITIFKRKFSLFKKHLAAIQALELLSPV